MEYITLIIGLASPVIYAITLFYFLKERKSTLRAVVYEKQIEACYEIMFLFSELEEMMKGWDYQKKNPNDIIYSGDCYEGTMQVHYKLSNAIRKYYLILPNEIFDAITNLNDVYNQEIENLKNDKKYEFPWMAVSFRSIEIYDMIRKEFGIQKLSESSKKVIEHFEEKKQ